MYYIMMCNNVLYCILLFIFVSNKKVDNKVR